MGYYHLSVFSFLTKNNPLQLYEVLNIQTVINET